MMEWTKVILEYVKTLIWPIVVVVALVMFAGDLKLLLKRVVSADVASVSVNFGTTAPETENGSSNNTRPDVWFVIRESNLSQEDCVTRANSALEATGFTNDRGNTPTRVVYGYTEDFVGAIWCGDPARSVLITVAGPSQKGLQMRHEELASSFSELSP